MAPDDISPHAETVRHVLAVLGSRSRARLNVMLQALGLSNADAEEVLTHGLRGRLFEPDPDEPGSLRARKE